MEPPAITPRRRRPFLAPFVVLLIAAVVAVGIGFALWRSASNTMVIVVPAAEGALGSIDDPPLSAAGSQQAQRLAQRFAGVSGEEGPTAIFVAGTLRAQQTAAPLAGMLGLKPIALAGNKGAAMERQIMRGHRGATVLVVCSRAQIVALVQALSGVAVSLPAPRALYIVSIPSVGPAKVLQMTD